MRGRGGSRLCLCIEGWGRGWCRGYRVGICVEMILLCLYIDAFCGVMERAL